MSLANDIAELTCGRKSGGQSLACEVWQVLSYLGSVISDNIDDIYWMFGQDEQRVSRYVPFLARAVLELGATALICRLDPTRLLFVKRTQELPSYSTDHVWKTAIRWQGDVLGERVTNIWSNNVAPKEMTRALVGDYYSDLYWRPALLALGDMDVSLGGRWLQELQALEPNAFVPSRRSALSKAFSESSKGIHHEFVIPPASRFDKTTCKALVTSVLKTVSEFGVLINLLPHVPYRITSSDAFNAIARIEQDRIYTI